MSNLINNILLKTHILQALGNQPDKIVFYQLNWQRVCLYLVLLLILLYWLFILKSRYKRWKQRHASSGVNWGRLLNGALN